MRIQRACSHRPDIHMWTLSSYCAYLSGSAWKDTNDTRGSVTNVMRALEQRAKYSMKQDRADDHDLSNRLQFTPLWESETKNDACYMGRCVHVT